MLQLHTINKKQQITITLSTIYGINKQSALNICYILGINPYIKAIKLSNTEFQKINYYIEKNYLTGTLLKYKRDTHIRNLIALKNYKGKRHSMSLPVRGQRTHTNAQTAKKLNKLKSWLLNIKKNL